MKSLILRKSGLLFSTYSLLLIILIVFCFRLWMLYLGYFQFSWDFGRDMLWVRKLTIDFSPILVGPWGSLEGSFFGPLYYYLLAPFLLLFKHDPRAAVLMVTIFISLLPLVIYWWGKRLGFGIEAWFWAAGIAILPWFTSLSLYSFSQQLIPAWSVLFLIGQWNFLRLKNWKTYMGLWLIAGLAWNFEPVNAGWAFLVAGWLGVLILKNKSWRDWLVMGSIALAGVVLSLLPNIVFDFRHNFTQILAFKRLLVGSDSSYGISIPFWFRPIDRWRVMIGLASEAMFFRNSIGLTVLMGVCLLIWNRWGSAFKTAKFQVHNQILRLVGYNLLGVFVYFLIFPKLLKDYYLYMVPLYVWMLTVLLLRLWWCLWPSWRKAMIIICGLFIVGMWFQNLTFGVYRNQAVYYAAQKEMVDIVYARAQGRPFKLYVYTPLVYDYPYQYLISWYGDRQYGYIPVEYGYLPNVPDYVYRKADYDHNKETRVGEGEVKVLLLRELDDSNQFYGRDDWLTHFPGAEEAEPENLPYGFELRVIEES